MNYSCSKSSYMVTLRFVAIGFFCVISLYANAQFKNIKVDEGTDGKRAAEPSIVINPSDPKNVVVATSEGIINYSFDAGQTWAKTKLNSSLGVFGDPVLVTDDKGTMYCLHLSDGSAEGLKNEKSLDQIICHISKDGGKTWEEGAPLGYNASKDQVKPCATVDSKGNLYVTWTQFDKYNSSDAGCQSTVLISSSSNVRKWSKPVVLTQNPGACTDDEKAISAASPTVSVDNKIYVAWATQDKIFIDRSFDGGGVWLFNDISAISWFGGWNVKIPGLTRNNELPTLLVDRSKGEYRGVLYLSWADTRSGKDDTDVWFARSHTYGDQWSTPAKMGDDKNGKHQFQPRMAVDQSTGFVYIVYYDRSGYEDNQTDVYLAYTSDSGMTFKNVKISETPFVGEDNATFGNYLSISASNGIIMPVWVRTDEGKTSVWTTLIKQDDIIPPAAPAKGKKKK
jgi:hypothetical protein